jgi:RNA polymerase sigma factor (sigma-70 family)
MEPLDTISDKELLEGCLRKERMYQEMLYRKYSRKMYAICQAYARDKDMAQDILQDSFVKIFLKINTYTHQNSLEGWIRRVVTNTAIDYFRQSRRLNNFIELVEEHNQQVSEDNITKAINVEEILYFLRKLPEGARVIFNLYAIEGYTHKEIADRLSISEGTSKSQYSRARGILQSYLTGLAGNV